MIWAHLQTIFSYRAYHRLAFATRLQCVGFVAYLGLLSLLVFYSFSSGYIRRNLPVFLKNFPQVTFEKGKLTAPDKPVWAYFPNSPFKIEFDAARQTPPTNRELIEKHTLALVTQSTVYMPGSTAVQTHLLPATFSATTSQAFLHTHQPLIAGALGTAAFMAAFFLIPLTLLFDFCIAAAVGFTFNLLNRSRVPRQVVLRWALFLLGPLSVLWYIRLWFNIPLFTLAQFILCIIYMQQIFNLLPEEK